MIDCEKLRSWLWHRQLECIPDGKEKHWLDHSTSALMTYENVLSYLKDNNYETVKVRGVDRELSEFDIQSNQHEVGVNRCQHEHDGMIYTSNPPQNKCRHCGEFYR